MILTLMFFYLFPYEPAAMATTVDPNNRADFPLRPKWWKQNKKSGNQQYHHPPRIRHNPQNGRTTVCWIPGLLWTQRDAHFPPRLLVFALEALMNVNSIGFAPHTFSTDRPS